MQQPSRRQPGQHPYARNSREQNPFFEKVTAPRHDPKTALRTANLNHLMQAAGIDKIKLAEALEMDIARVGDYLEGSRDFNEGIAQHVEEQLGLEPSFMDTRHTPPLALTEETLQILRGEVLKSDEEEFTHPEVSAMAVAAPPVTATSENPVAEAPIVETAALESSSSEAEAEIVTQANATSSEEAVHATKAEPIAEPATQRVVEEARSIHIVPTQPRVEPVATVVPTVATPRPKVQKHSEVVVIHSMAKPTTQENEVTEMTISEEAMLERRRANFNILAEGKGAKAAIARVMAVSPGHVTLLVQRKRDISEPLARDIETYFGLEKGWLDEKPTKGREAPQVALMAIANGEPVARPARVEEDRPRRGRPRGSKNAATLEREAAEGGEEAPTEIVVKTPGKRGRKPGVKNAPAQPAVAQAELALAEEAAQSATSHAAPHIHIATPAGAKGAKAQAPRAAAPAAAPVARAAAPIATHAAAPAKHTPAAHAPVGVSDDGGLSALLGNAQNLAPVTFALLKVIIEKSAEGRFGNEEAMKMLPSVLEL